LAICLFLISIIFPSRSSHILAKAALVFPPAQVPALAAAAAEAAMGSSVPDTQGSSARLLPVSLTLLPRYSGLKS